MRELICLLYFCQYLKEQSEEKFIYCFIQIKTASKVISHAFFLVKIIITWFMVHINTIFFSLNHLFLFQKQIKIWLIIHLPDIHNVTVVFNELINSCPREKEMRIIFPKYTSKNLKWLMDISGSSKLESTMFRIESFF